MTASQDFLSRLLQPERLTRIADIGANPIDGDPPYKAMLAKGLCEVVGFEPQPEGLAQLEAAKGPNERYLPYVIGNGEPQTLYCCEASGMTSLLKPDAQQITLFTGFDQYGRVVEERPVETRKLDDVEELGVIDMLKIDIQGSELSVFESGRGSLAQTVLIQTEVSFAPLYEGQPLLWEVERELYGQGFMTHTLAALKSWPMAPYRHPDNPLAPVRQLLEADMVYVRDFVQGLDLSDEQLKHLALLAHHCYQSADLVMRCINLLESRDALDSGALDAYRSELFPGYKFVDA